MADITQNWRDMLIVLGTLVLLGTIFGLLFLAYYRFAAMQFYKLASMRLPAGNAAIVKGDSLSSISKPGGEIVRRGSLSFRIQSERDVWVLYVWEASFGRNHWVRLKRFNSHDKAVSYIAEYVYILEQTQSW
jgi:hypothetical protein